MHKIWTISGLLLMFIMMGADCPGSKEPNDGKKSKHENLDLHDGSQKHEIPEAETSDSGSSRRWLEVALGEDGNTLYGIYRREKDPVGLGKLYYLNDDSKSPVILKPKESNATKLYWKSISAAGSYFCGIASDGKIYCGSGGGDPRQLPGEYAEKSWTQISAGGSIFAAIDSDNNLYKWRKIPKEASDINTALDKWTAVSVNGWGHGLPTADRFRMCAINKNKQLFCGSDFDKDWKQARDGQWRSVATGSAFALGIDTVEGQIHSIDYQYFKNPNKKDMKQGEGINVPFKELRGWGKIFAHYIACAIAQDKKLYCWNDANQSSDGAMLGIGENISPTEPNPDCVGSGEKLHCSKPQQIHKITDCSMTSSGDGVRGGDVDVIFWRNMSLVGYRACAISAEGELYCWGRVNDKKMFGIETQIDHERWWSKTDTQYCKGCSSNYCYRPQKINMPISE